MQVTRWPGGGILPLRRAGNVPLVIGQNIVSGSDLTTSRIGPPVPLSYDPVYSQQSKPLAKLHGV